MTKEEQWLLDEKYGGEKTEGFFTDCERLKVGEPLGYVIGFVPFLESKIWLDGHPLIPRPETEFWVEKAIEEIRSVRPAAPRVLDLCAGSGAIGIAVARAVPEAHVDFVEIDTNLLLTISKNMEENLTKPEKTSSSRPGLELDGKPRYRVFSGDLFDVLAPSARPGLALDTYDFILSNPPYIDPSIDRAEPSVKEFEPHLALYGGQSGMEVIARIIEKAPLFLNQKGQLWIEHEPEQSDNIKKLGEGARFTVSTHTDQYGVERYSVLIQ